jgi:hypothetical protein
MQSHLEFDIDSDGAVSVEEARVGCIKYLCIFVYFQKHARSAITQVCHDLTVVKYII